MDLFAILIGLVILAVIALFVSRPLLTARRAAQAGGVDVALLEAERDGLYAQVKELDMDHATGKVNDEDYTRLRAELVAQAAEVLKRIDAATTATPPPADDVEALIAARRKPRSAPAAQSADADVEAAIAARRKTALPVSSAPRPEAPACPNCGKPVNSADAFCAKCGTALHPEPAR